MTTGALLALVSVSFCVGPQLGFRAQGFDQVVLAHTAVRAVVFFCYL